MIRYVSKRCPPRFDPSSLIFSPTSPFHTLFKRLHSPSNLTLVSHELEERGWGQKGEESDAEEYTFVAKKESEIKISHPWPEWVDLMECLLQRGYFDGAERNPFGNGELKRGKDSNIIRTACLNFGRDQFELLRFLSPKDIGVTVAFGCPSLDRKVINSGKRLRAHVAIDEGNVCSSCNLRGDCDRAFVKAREDEGGRTVDVMRIILTYGLDPIIGSVDNKPCLNKKVKDSVRRLLKEIIEHSTQEENSNVPDTSKEGIGQVLPNPQDKGRIDVPMKQGDWLCPKCNFMNFARNIRCLRCDSLFEEKIKQLQEDNNQLPLKKGDWICNICNFLNFAKNTRCLQCKEKPPKRQLNPGEWECDSCNYINFRRNMVCLKCDHRRPRATKASTSSLYPERQDMDYHNKNNKLTSLRPQMSSDESSLVSERKNRSRGARMWRFVEDRVKNDKCLNTLSDPSQFIDFPIVGGKTELSQAQRREVCKNELTNRSRMLLCQSETEDELWSPDNLSTDDDEWNVGFGKE